MWEESSRARRNVASACLQPGTIFVRRSLFEARKLFCEGPHALLDRNQWAMQHGGRCDVEAQHVAIRLAQDLAITRLGVVAHEVVRPAVARAWDASTAQQRVAAAAQRGNNLLGA